MTINTMGLRWPLHLPLDPEPANPAQSACPVHRASRTGPATPALAAQCARFAKLVACAGLLLVSRMASGQMQTTSPATLQWTLVPKSCATIQSASPPMACGEYGTFYFGSVDTGSCQVIAHNAAEVLKSYAKSIVAKTFVPIGHEEHPAFHSQSASQRNFPQAPGSSSQAKGRQDLLAVPVDPIPYTNWVAVIDTEGAHAHSVAYLIAELGGPEVGVQELSIDDPALTQTLGSTPTDFHVIGQVCNVLNQIEGPAPVSQPPSVINLSIGRKLEAGDPADDTSCDQNTAGCQLARLLARAKGHNSSIVVALGNQRDRIWPANLGSVIGAGQLSVRHLLDSGAIIPAWENPPGLVRALFVGNSLCLGGWPAPAGSSYSAATASGLIAEARSIVPGFDPYASGTLVPKRDAGSGRWGLARNGSMVGGTSTVLTGLYNDLTTGSCWNGGTNVADATEGAWTPGYAPRSTAPFPTWTSMTFNPAPVEDPCTPCFGIRTSDGFSLTSNALSVNLSQAAPLAQTKHIDAAHLRVGNGFYALNLSRATRVQLRNGTLRTLVLPGMWANLQTTPDASIVFTILNAPNAMPPNPPDPDQGHLCPSLPASSCYWISTPILRQQ